MLNSNMVYGATDISTTTDKIMSSTEALNAVKDADLPTGITLMGTVEPVKPPTTTKKEGNVRVEESDEHKEWFGGGVDGEDGEVMDHIALDTRVVVSVVGHILLDTGMHSVQVCMVVAVVLASLTEVSTTVRYLLKRQ